MGIEELFALLSDAEEGPLFRPFLAATATDADRDRYHAWLATRPGPRGDLIRHLALPPHDLDGPARERHHLRTTELIEATPYGWWKVVRPVPWVLNCGEAAEEPPPVRFAFECPRSWETLTPTDAQNERHCSQCERRVYLCRDRAEAERRAMAGQCIAVAAALAGQVSGEVSRHITGQPHPPSLWADRLFGRR